MEQERLLGSVAGSGNLMLSSPAITTSFSLPLTGYTTRLLPTVHHRLFLGDCMDPRSEDDDDISVDESHCAYWKSILVLDLVWNMAFVVVAAGVLLSTLDEQPLTPLRLWLCGYAFECVLHMGFVYFEYQRRNSGYHGTEVGCSVSQSRKRTSLVKKLETMNTLASSVWWVLGFYWIVVAGQSLLEDCPCLYRLTVVFLALDILFIVFCIGMACIAFFALICFVPIVALAYAISTRDGASEEDVRSLSKYKFSQSNSLMLVADYNEQVVQGSNHVNEVSLHPDDSECCICLSPYVNGVELYRLPCTHHFHCECISRWLRTKPTCPLCKFNILRNDTLV